jgi:hypothetical protein
VPAPGRPLNSAPACTSRVILDDERDILGVRAGWTMQSQVHQVPLAGRPACIRPGAVKWLKITGHAAATGAHDLRGLMVFFLPPDSGLIGALLPVAHLRSAAGGIQ